MARQLVFLTAAVVAALEQTDVSTCGDLFSADRKCQNDTQFLLQVASVPESFPYQKTMRPAEARGGPFGRFGPKHQKNVAMASINDWHSSRDLARVWGVQTVAISPQWTMRIFSAVPVFGKDEAYIALLVEQADDVWKDPPYKWERDFHHFVMFCAGPGGSHKGHVTVRGDFWVCPWPREESMSRRFHIFLEDKNGKQLGQVLVDHDPGLLKQYKTMACVRDMYYSPNPESRMPFSGVLKQWVEWIEWSSLHGLEHFLVYTFEGTDLAGKEILERYLDAGIASRVHFQFYAESIYPRFGELINDCLYRAKNHAKWLAASVDVDEYMVFPGKMKYFNWDGVLKEQGISEDEVASIDLRRIRFARARPEALEISSDYRDGEPDRWLKPIILVDNVYRTSIHKPAIYKAGTQNFQVNPELAIIHHYRAPTGNTWKGWVDYENLTFNDPDATVKDQGLQKDMRMLKAAVARRFNIPASAVNNFLKSLAFRRPPGITSAAKH